MSTHTHTRQGGALSSFAAWGLALWLSCFAVFAAHAAEEYLDPQVAFQLSIETVNADQVNLHYKIAKSYRLYRDKFQLSYIQDGKEAPIALTLPTGKRMFDITLGHETEVYRDTLNIPVSSAMLRKALADSGLSKANTLQLISQGCADAGLCYPPQTQDLQVLSLSPLSLQLQASTESGFDATRDIAKTPAVATPNNTPNNTQSSDQNTDSIGQALQSGNWLWVAGVFGLAGLLLSFTPCVLPMVPILGSIIVNASQGNPTSRRKGFLMALSYSFGMSLVYTALGVAAGLAGQGLAASLQNPWVLSAFAVLLCVLALSMLGLYELQLPSSWQSRLNERASSLRGGRMGSVMAMGAISALIVGPCVAAPLAGALVYISQTGDVVLGGFALFCLAWGMSVPLLLVGLSAQTLLPRVGAWMDSVKSFFGIALLAVALYMVQSVLPSAIFLALVALLIMLCAVMLYKPAQASQATATAGQRLLGALRQALALMLFVVAVAELLGTLGGGSDLLRPLQPFTSSARGSVSTSPVGASTLPPVPFTPVRDLAEFQAQLAATPGPVMLDLYADWCVACKEFEHFTLSDPRVQQRLAGVKILRMDVTANNAQDKAFMKHFSLFGPPALLFFNTADQEQAQARVVGFENAERFLKSLDRANIL